MAAQTTRSRRLRLGRAQARHYIFPQKWCQDRAISRSQYNCILNNPHLHKANRMIGGRAPSVYLQQLQTHEHVQLTNESMDDILQSHAIPPEYLRTDDFESFLVARQQTLLKKIETAMGKPIFFAEEVAEPEAAEVG